MPGSAVCLEPGSSGSPANRAALPPILRFGSAKRSPQRRSFGSICRPTSSGRKARSRQDSRSHRDRKQAEGGLTGRSANRRASQICRLEQTRGSDVIEAWRKRFTAAAHLSLMAAAFLVLGQNQQPCASFPLNVASISIGYSIHVLNFEASSPGSGGCGRGVRMICTAR